MSSKKKEEIERMFRNLELTCLKPSIEEFVYDLHDFYLTKGFLSEKQIAALRRIFEKVD